MNKNINKKTLSNLIYQKIGFSKIISENIVNDIFYLLKSNFFAAPAFTNVEA